MRSLRIFGLLLLVLSLTIPVFSTARMGGIDKFEHLDDIDKNSFSLSNKEFADLINNLSEEDKGMYTGQNFVSNEASYLQIFPGALNIGVGHDVYLGVGPEQNFSYIAKFKPRVAFILDIRRDNLLEILMMKAIFEMASTPAEYLQLLLGKDGDTLQALLSGVPSNKGNKFAEGIFKKIIDQLTKVRYLKLSVKDLDRLWFIYYSFFSQGENIQCDRGPMMPTFKDLIFEKDADGELSNYLSSQESYDYVRSMHLRNAIIPVVCNFAGTKALLSLGIWLKKHNLNVSVFYVSSVQNYIMSSDLWVNWRKNTKSLPWEKRGIFIVAFYYMGSTNESWHDEARIGYGWMNLVWSSEEFLKSPDTPPTNYPSLSKHYIKIKYK